MQHSPRTEFLSIYNVVIISTITKRFWFCRMMYCPMVSSSTFTAFCYCCPGERWSIFQHASSAASASLIEIFMWMNHDLNCETVGAVQMCFPIKRSLLKLFLQCPEVELFNQKVQFLRQINKPSFFIFRPMRKTV